MTKDTIKINEKAMEEKGKILLGFFLVAMGSALLVENLGLIKIDWIFLINLWPIILILVGVSKILSSKNLGISQYMILLSFFALITTLAFLAFTLNESMQSVKKQKFTKKYEKTIEKAHLSLDLGAGDFKVLDTPDQMIEIESETNIGEYNLESNYKDHSAYYKFNPKSKKIFQLFGFGTKNNANIFLNTKVYWAIDSKLGAGNFDFDLRPIKIESLKIDSGAASVNLKLGDKVDKLVLDINSGASFINISVPKDSGCQIVSETGISNKEFLGFHEKTKNIYETENFISAKSKIYINVKAGVTNIKVTRD